MDGQFYLVEAFGEVLEGGQPRRGSGNGAGVVLLDGESRDWPSEGEMLALANTVNQSETAFVRRVGESWGIRWFTPEVEVELCGHATLAAGRALVLAGEVGRTARFWSASGELWFEWDGLSGWLDFPAAEVVEGRGDDEVSGMVAGLFRAPVWVGTGGGDWLVELADEGAVADYEADMAEISRLGRRGLAVTARVDASGFVYRFFAPQSGVPEDPATGSAQCYLAPYWGVRTGSRRLRSWQLSSRGGFFESEWVGERVRIGGAASVVASGRLEV